MSTIVNQTKWSLHKTTIQKVQAHSGTIGNEMTNQLANDITTLA